MEIKFLRKALLLAFWVYFLDMCKAKDIKASAIIFSANKSQVFGTLNFLQKTDTTSVKITGTLTDIKPTGIKHGFHVHALGDLGNGCKDAKGHFNPEKEEHGAPNGTMRHVGDLGNVESDSAGSVTVNIYDSIIQLYGPHSIIGRAIVIHAGTDDLGKEGNAESKKTGNAGDRLGCGVVGISSADYDPTMGKKGSGAGRIPIFGVMVLMTMAIAICIFSN